MPKTAAVKQNEESPKGFRIDAGKPKMALVPTEAIFAIAEVLTRSTIERGGKYPERNWELGMDWSLCYDATQRHLLKWQSGHRIDADSGMPNLWHAITDLAMLLTYEQRGIGTDNLSGVEAKGSSPIQGEFSFSGRPIC